MKLEFILAQLKPKAYLTCLSSILELTSSYAMWIKSLAQGDNNMSATSQ